MAAASVASHIVPKQEVIAFVERCMGAVGTPVAHASALAQALMTADYRGHFSHGLNRLDMYVQDIRSGMTVKDGEPTVVNERAGTAFVNGNNLLGPVVSNFCMDLAMKKAKDAGIGWVVACGSNHYSIAGYYSLKACDQGLVGMSFTNTSPLVVPTRARKGVLGTNPISVAAPGKEGDSFVLDMATSTCALGKIELHDRKGLPIPTGWGVDSAGRETTNPKAVLEGGGQMALGGSEVTGGYKGYGLAMMVELFCGILSGGAYGPNVRRWKTNDRVANLGQCFVAIDPEAFAPGFQDRMQDMMDCCRNLEPAEGETEVLVAGDPERKHMAMCDAQGGIPYHVNQFTHLQDLAKQLEVEPLKEKK
ncbi:putative oxidoreductase YjmC isoform X1 [Branchiostoma floridae x Branchiostoma japonicum]